ncbi:MAG: hypothetical protein ACRDYX_21365 [Egibacteraceae bacterium]
MDFTAERSRAGGVATVRVERVDPLVLVCAACGWTPAGCWPAHPAALLLWAVIGCWRDARHGQDTG